MGHRGNASVRWRFDREPLLDFRTLARAENAGWIPGLRCREVRRHPLDYRGGQGRGEGGNTPELSRARLDRIGRTKTVLGVAHASPACGAWGAVKAAVDRADCRNGLASGHGQ